MIFTYNDYKLYINTYFKSLPNNGRGQASALAKHLQTSNVSISQILKGNRDFTDEHAYKTTSFLKLDKLEKKYFLSLVSYNKCSNFELKNYLKSELEEFIKESKKVKSQYKEKTKELSDEDKIRFYSDKNYSAIRMLASTKNINTSKQIAEHFNLSIEESNRILEFLLTRSLIKKENDKLCLGNKHTFLPADSPYIRNHHKNWRLYSIEKTDQYDIENEIMYTAPLSLSKEAYQEIKEKILNLIKESIDIVTPSKEETVACLNIDFLKF